jgi:hypothetical protein
VSSATDAIEPDRSKITVMSVLSFIRLPFVVAPAAVGRGRPDSHDNVGGGAGLTR